MEELNSQDNQIEDNQEEANYIDPENFNEDYEEVTYFTLEPSL